MGWLDLCRGLRDFTAPLREREDYLNKTLSWLEELRVPYHSKQAEGGVTSLERRRRTEYLEEERNRT